MSGSTYGTLFTVTTWGESHGAGIGAVIDGCPAGLPLSEDDIQLYLNRRKPGQNKYTTMRREEDHAEILSGVFEGRTTGTPISILVRNEDQRSRDYGKIKSCYRPGHADYTFHSKYGCRDYRGGGRSSGRETIGRVAAGAVAARVLLEFGIQVQAYTRSISSVHIPDDALFPEHIGQNPLYMPNNEYAQKAAECLDSCIKNLDSAGGVIECTVTGLPAGIGEPVFDKLDAALAKGIMSIGAVKGVEIGDGFAAATSCGSQNNDSFFSENNILRKSSNHAGGVLGGISDGSALIIRAAIKPTPSIGQGQQTVTEQMENTTISISGRHDPVIVPRAVVVVESMTAVTVLDMLLRNMGARMDKIKDFYQKQTI